MKKKIKNNITAKLFIIICSAFIFACLTIIGSLSLILPSVVMIIPDEEFAKQVDNLILGLNGQDFKTVNNHLENFVKETNSTAFLENSLGAETRYSNTPLPSAQEPIEVELNSKLEVLKGEERTLTIDDVIQTKNQMGSYGRQLMIDDESYFLRVIGGMDLLTNGVGYVLKNTIPWILLSVSLLSFIISWFLSRFITKPIKEICSITKELATLNFEVTCSENRSDELGELSRNINFLSAKLSGALGKLTEELQYEKELEEKQRLFFAAASHELKTPLTIIKSKIEGMMYGYEEYKDRDIHLGHTLKTVSDMEHLINEILTTSQIAGDNILISEETINVKDVVEEILRGYSDFIKIKNLEIKTNLSDEIILADKILMTKAIQNIINNAINYTPSDENILIHLSESKLTIENFGVSINNDDLDKLCEPFYRVEKSRNKKTGGTGLGLYFAKTIIERYGYNLYISTTKNSIVCEVNFILTL